MTCKNCTKTTQDQYGNLICVNALSDNCGEWVHEDNSCDKFEDKDQYVKDIGLSMEMQ